MTKARTLADFDSSGVLTSASTLDATKLSGNLPALDGSSLTGIAAGGGVTEADQWRITSNFTGSATPITSNWERSDNAGYSKLGTGLTNSSGIFSFPSTGVYIIYAQMSVQFMEEDTDSIMSIATTVNNGSSYYAQSTTREADKNSDGRHHSMSCMAVFDVTDVATHKFRIDAQSVGSTNVVKGNSGETLTGFTVFRLADT